MLVDVAPAEAEELLALLDEGENTLFVTPVERISEIASDPDDNKFLECALAAQADAIISGDRHLLDLGQFRRIPILDPGAFLNWLLNG